MKRVVPVAALLATFFALSVVQAPAAQSEPPSNNQVQVVAEQVSVPKQIKIVKPVHKAPKKHVKLSATPLSTNINPSIIRSKVHAAWVNHELLWSSPSEWECWDQIIQHESGWNPWADNGMGWEETGGIPQAHPSNKMAEAGKDYRTNVWTQVRWGLNYIRSTYGDPCSAWSAWQQRATDGPYGWY